MHIWSQAPYIVYIYVVIKCRKKEMKEKLTSLVRTYKSFCSNASTSLLYSYTRSFNGFVVKLTNEEMLRVAGEFLDELFIKFPKFCLMEIFVLQTKVSSRIPTI